MRELYKESCPLEPSVICQGSLCDRLGKCSLKPYIQKSESIKLVGGDSP